jgi:hypothetical protein
VKRRAREKRREKRGKEGQPESVSEINRQSAKTCLVAGRKFV